MSSGILANAHRYNSDVDARNNHAQILVFSKRQKLNLVGLVNHFDGDGIYNPAGEQETGQSIPVWCVCCEFAACCRFGVN